MKRKVSFVKFKGHGSQGYCLLLLSFANFE